MEPSLGSFRPLLLQPPPDGGSLHLKHANDDAPAAGSAPSAKSGSYGVSIRVQGIDGHPYIVLNNAEQGLLENHVAPENGQPVAAQALSSSVPGASSSHELEKTKGEGRRCWSTYRALPSKLKRMRPASVDDGEKSSSQVKAGLPKSSSLLNFQRHPELLQPYDPESNVLDLEEIPFPPSHASKSLAEEEGRMGAEPRRSPLEVVPLNKATLQVAQVAKPKPKTVDLTMPAAAAAAEDVSEQERSGIGPGLNGTHGSPSSSGGSLCAASPPTVQEPRKCRPDLLPFRRQDSAGSALNSSRRSSSSSATPTSAASLYKFFLDDQECAIYADNVNRHENRRYIPFLPGTGRDIDTGSIPAVDRLIEKFDQKTAPHRRGRLGMRNRIRPEDRKRSRSLDSAVSPCLALSPEGLGGFSPEEGTSSEQVRRPAKASLQAPFSPPCPGQAAAPRAVGRLRAAPAAGSPSSYFSSLQYRKQSKDARESLAYKSSTLPIQNRNVESKTTAPSLSLPTRAEAQKNSVKRFASSSKVQVTWGLAEN